MKINLKFKHWPLLILGGILLCAILPVKAENLKGVAPNAEALRRAIEDLGKTFPEKYTRATEFLKRLDEIAGPSGTAGTDSKATGDKLRALQQEALLANPLLDFERLLFIKRGANKIGLPQNWEGDCALKGAFDNELDVLSPVCPDGKQTTLFKPEKPVFIGDIDLEFDAGKMLFSMPGPNNRWHVWEIQADGTGLRQVTPDMGDKVNSYDPCYLPDGRIIFASTACIAGVPCVGGGSPVANLFRMDADGKNVRQLCFDQEHNWCPTVLHDGRVLYTRWEYTDTPHYFTRLLFRMNPDGTGQSEYYGSNSYWPNSTFFARPIPGKATAVAGIISGHHGAARMGELVVFDPERGRHEADGAIQRIPGYGKKVDPKIADQLVNNSWPKFLHPYPLSDKYILVACQPSKDALWGIYLVDVFDNLTLILEVPGYALLEPIPFRKVQRPPVIPDKVRPDSREATVYLNDVYAGEGLKGVPRGTVKSLRVIEYHYAYWGMGGHINIGIDGPWDVHRIVGTVPVNKDGSAAFKVPANTPLAVQPLDDKGCAIQVMRSWFTAMPGEVVSCMGCHDRQNASPSTKMTLASRSEPVAITPWHGPARGFDFAREVQPVLDRNCVGCHNGETQPDGKTIPNFRMDQPSGTVGTRRISSFDASYVALHPYVHRPGPESDYHLQAPYEWHASTSELIQLLRKGHYDVRLNSEDWDRLVTWIDLNVPDHGTWAESRPFPDVVHKLRMETRTKYGNRPEDPEQIFNPYQPGAIKFQPPKATHLDKQKEVAADGWPFDAAESKTRQQNAGPRTETQVELAKGVTLKLELAPAGEFVMGDPEGAADEKPVVCVKINKPFWVGKFEVTNAQYQLFDPNHDSGYVYRTNKDHADRGVPANRDAQPAIRVTWKEAMAYCEWLSKKTGHKFSLPNEAQWEYACRAGTGSPLSYGATDADFSKTANLADVRLEELAIRDSPKWIPSVRSVNDGFTGPAPVGSYPPNAWGICDMHGNAAEWTLSTYKPYPYKTVDGKNEGGGEGLKVVRGGSFYDRPTWARSASRIAYEPFQSVFDVGFRVVMEE